MSGTGLARATTVLFIMRDGTGIPNGTSPPVLDFFYPADISRGLYGEHYREETSSVSHSINVKTNELQSGDVLRIDVAMFTRVDTGTLASGLGNGDTDDGTRSMDGSSMRICPCRGRVRPIVLD